MLHVDVRDNNVDQALRVLKKKMQREGLLREMRAKEFYEKPSVKKARQAKEAIKRKRKPIALEPSKWAFDLGRKSSCITYTNQIPPCYNSGIFKILCIILWIICA
jgi:small subunit ribosomal protein S21